MSNITLKSLVKEKFLDIAKAAHKGKKNWVTLSSPAIKPIAKNDFPTKRNLFDLIDFAYRSVLHEPNISIKFPNDVLGQKYDYWEAINIDEAPDADAVIFGKKRNGVKISGFGHDGEKLSKSILINKNIELLKKGHYWVEASGIPAKIYIDANVPMLTDKDKIIKLFPNSKITELFDDGSYTRIGSGGKILRKQIFGNPII